MASGKEGARDRRAFRERSLLGRMLLIRRFEEKAAQMYGLKKIGGFCHLYIGQEAAAVGAIAAIDLSRDYTVGAYRDHGYALACGMDPRGLMAELFGKATGVSKGKGGSMHFFDAARHMFGGNGIVGAQIPVATGVALKCRYRKDGGVVLCWFGDGAIHQGSFHESLNMAKIWKLPIIYICENNQYGMGTDFRRVSSVTDFVVMGHSYGIPGQAGERHGCAGGVPRRGRGRGAGARGSDPRVPGDQDVPLPRPFHERPGEIPHPGGAGILQEAGPAPDPESPHGRGREPHRRSSTRPWTRSARQLCDEAVKFAEESPEPEPSALYEDVLA